MISATSGSESRRDFSSIYIRAKSEPAYVTPSNIRPRSPHCAQERQQAVSEGQRTSLWVDDRAYVDPAMVAVGWRDMVARICGSDSVSVPPGCEEGSFVGCQEDENFRTAQSSGLPQLKVWRGSGSPIGGAGGGCMQQPLCTVASVVSRKVRTVLFLFGLSEVP